MDTFATDVSISPPLSTTRSTIDQERGEGSVGSLDKHITQHTLQMSSSEIATELYSHTNVREWMGHSQVAVLDRFLLMLRQGRLTSNPAAPKQSVLSQDRRIVTHRTVDLLRQLIGATKWKSPAQLLSLLRGVGCELHAAGGFREPAIANVVRRIMAAVREEVTVEDRGGDETRLTLQSMLWALPQQNVQRPVSAGRSLGDRQESMADGDFQTEYPEAYYVERVGSDFKSSIMEASK